LFFEGFRYCEGGDLLIKLSSLTKFSESVASGIMKQVLAAVDYCHKNKIVHRDLKPENIVFEGDSIESTLKIIDFGRSKIVKKNEILTEKSGFCN